LLLAYNARYVKIENHTDLVKDKKTGAVLNMSNDVAKARKAKDIRISKDQKIKDLETDVKEIKDMLEKVMRVMSKENG
jgi:tetrahydromethanopterin S-methyltransferase subunit B|tara:strand:- start:682 stop:915 length:234 start_codon:yes stop_codon:yes gene_type:complete